MKKNWISILILVLFLYLATSFAHSQDLPLYKPSGLPPYKGLYSTQEYKETTLNRVNYHRSLANLPLVTLSEKLSEVAQAHANYLDINNEVGHSETEGKPGFVGQWPKDRATALGYDWAAIGEVISFGLGPEQGVDSLIMAIYHRFILLSPSYTEAGVGDSDHPTYGKVQVINLGRPKGSSAPKGIIAVYPAENQEEVPTSFDSDTEYPDPAPDLKIVGYPVSIHFSDEYQVVVSKFELKKENQGLETIFISQSNNKAFSIVPKSKLEPNNTYECYFEGTLNGQPYNKTWFFKTVESDTIKAEPSHVTIAVGETVEVALINAVGGTQAFWTNPSVSTIELSPSSITITGKAVGTQEITVKDQSQAQTKIYVWVMPTLSQEMDLGPSWNLLALPLKPSVTDLDSLFPGTEGINSIWKWSKGKWAVCLPGEADKGASYAASKGFTLLTSIQYGEGFWVNLSSSKKIMFSGIQYVGNIFVAASWNLLGLKATVPVEVSNLLSGKEADILSVWMWEGGKWFVYLPGGDTAGYAQSKGFGVLTTIDPGRGFWVNAKKSTVL